MKLLKKQLQRRGKIYSSRLFKTNEKLQREHSVMVLCDYSGSMDNPNKLPLSKEAMISLATMLKELKVNFCLRAFSSTDSNPAETEDLLLKNFGEELSDKKISDIIKTYSSMGSNRDGTAIKNATDKLSAERGAKLLIVISDGKPAAYKYNGSPARKHTIEAIRRAEKKGIKVIGVGIADGANTVPELYKRHVCIGDIQQLSEKLIKLYVKAAEELSN